MKPRKQKTNDDAQERDAYYDREPRNDRDDYLDRLHDEENQDHDLGGTGHGDISWSDADPGL